MLLTSRLRRSIAWTTVPFLLWIGLVIVARLRGLAVMDMDRRAALPFPPLAARFDPRVGWRAVLPFSVALLIVAVGPSAARMAPWRTLQVAAFLAAAVWALALAQIDGAAGLRGDVGYLADAARVVDPGAFIDHFVESIGSYSAHVRAHPPGFVVLLRAMRGIGLGGAGWEAALVMACGAGAVPAVLVAAREVAGEEMARAAAPFLVLAPIAIWVATSADGLYMGVTAWALTLIVLATGRTGRPEHLLALSGGVLFGVALYLSYGITLAALVPIAVAIARRRIRPLLVAGAGAALVAAAFAGAGFWWVDGLHATVSQYRAGVARIRPQSEFWLIDLGAFALALGPATFVGLARLHQPRLWLLVGAALAAVLLADASGLSKAEVERIWLPFAPWILVANASLGGDSRAARPWLALQAALALALQLALVVPIA